MSEKSTVLEFLRRLDADEEGGVSLEMVLIIAAIAVPILVFVWKYVWPAIQTWLMSESKKINIDIDSSPSDPIYDN